MYLILVITVLSLSVVVKKNRMHGFFFVFIKEGSQNQPAYIMHFSTKTGPIRTFTTERTVMHN